MVDNQHQKITGYRDLSEQEIAQMNKIKELGKQLEALIADIEEDAPDHDARWLSVGRTDLQKGLMALTRAIAKPTSF